MKKTFRSIFATLGLAMLVSACNFGDVIGLGAGGVTILKEVAPVILAAAGEAKKAVGIKAKARIFATLYCQIRSDYPKSIAKIREKFMYVVPVLVVNATKSLIDKKCGGATAGGVGISESSSPAKLPGIPAVAGALPLPRL